MFTVVSLLQIKTGKVFACEVADSSSLSQRFVDLVPLLIRFSPGYFVGACSLFRF